jgi:thymidylate kinase
MIVEFIGCDGAGKTTLTRMLQAHGIDQSPVIATPDLLLGRPGLRRITHPTAVNLVQDVCGLPFLLGALHRRREFVAFSARSLARRAPSTFVKLNEMRGVLRTVGMFELARRRARDRIVLSDDGPVLTAYFFALTENEGVERDELERFAQLVPRPDALVYVKAPVASLVRRAVSRPDRRRHHAGKDLAQIERRIRRTVDVFERVAATEPLRERVIVVENDDDDSAQRQRLVEELAIALERARTLQASTASMQPQHASVQLRPDSRP